MIHASEINLSSYADWKYAVRSDGFSGKIFYEPGVGFYIKMHRGRGRYYIEDGDELTVTPPNDRMPCEYSFNCTVKFEKGGLIEPGL